MHIGLVLAAVPAYSETFFVNKIRFLQEAGMQVTVFADQRSAVSFAGSPVVYGVGADRNGGIGWFAFWRAVWGIMKAPGKALALWSRNRQSGFSSKKNLISLISSLHILPYKADWLHFGFGTLAIGREHVASVMGAKMAVSFRGFDIAIYPLKHKDCYKLLWCKVDKVHVISDDLMKLVYTEGYSHDKVLMKITPAIDTLSIANKRSREQGNVTQIVTTARLHWKKGLEYTLEAMALIKDAGINFHYSIIGDGEERERLIFATYQLGLQDQVTFCGRLNHDETLEKLSKADVYIQYSIQEGFCNAVLEAQAMGLLCVVSDAEGLTENVVHGVTGWVVPKRRPDLLAAKIKEVIALDEATIKSIKNTATERIMNDFSIEKQRNEFIRFYTEN